MSENNSEDEKEIKVILLGNSGVGKTSIINRYVNNVYNSNCETTLGSTYSTREVIKDNVVYKLNLWDTTGQEKYHSITNLFIKGSSIVILVYSIDLLSSFEGLNYLYNSIKENLEGNNYVLAVVGSKSDLINEEEEVVSEDEAKKFAKERNAIFKLVSSKEDPVGINNLFDMLLDELIRMNYITVKDSYVIKRKKHKDDKEKKKKKCC
jgi:small GTP-binding protein